MELPGLQLVPITLIVPLLQSALSAVGVPVADELVLLPDMQQLASARMLHPLGTGTADRNMPVLEVLLMLPGAQQLLPFEVVKSLSCAISKHNIAALQLLLLLPAMYELSAENAAELLESSIGAGGAAVRLLVRPQRDTGKLLPANQGALEVWLGPFIKQTNRIPGTHSRTASFPPVICLAVTPYSQCEAPPLRSSC